MIHNYGCNVNLVPMPIEFGIVTIALLKAEFFS
jgi:hypothetical protein